MTLRIKVICVFLFLLSIEETLAQRGKTIKISPFEVEIIGLDKPFPTQTQFIEKIDFSDSRYLQNCSKNGVLEEAKILAASLGGNAIKILNEYEKTDSNNCYGFDGEILFINKKGKQQRLSPIVSTITTSELIDSEEKEEENSIENHFPHIKDTFLIAPSRLSVSFGRSSLTPKTPSDYPEWQKEYQTILNSGTVISIESLTSNPENFRLGKHGAKMFGAELSYFHTQHKIGPVAITYEDEYGDEQTVMGNISDKISIITLSSSSLYYFPIQKLRTNLLMHIKFGILYYQNKFEFIENYIHRSASVVITPGIGFETKLSKGLFITGNVSAPRSKLFFGFINNETSDEAYDAPEMKIGRLDATIGLSYRLKDKPISNTLPKSLNSKYKPRKWYSPFGRTMPTMPAPNTF